MEQESHRILIIVDTIPKELGVDDLCNAEISEFEREVRPRDLIKQLEKHQAK